MRIGTGAIVYGDEVVADAPVVTVVIPVWGAYIDRYLEEALASVREQGVPTRLLVVDNASEQPVESSDDVIVVRAHARLSVGEARNLGLALVRTPYVIFWDADDVVLPGALQALMARAASDPAAVVVSGRIIDATDRVLHWPRPWTTRLARLPSLFAVIHCVSSLFPTIGVLIQTEAARAAGGFPDTEAGDDWIFGVSLAFRGRVLFIGDHTRLYRAHSESMSFHWETRPHIVRNARGVRLRLRSDAGLPRWVAMLVPMVGAFQAAVLFGIRPVSRRLRRSGRPGRPVG